MLRSALIALALSSLAAPAALASGLTAAQTVERQIITKAADGTEKVAWIAADKATPGDVLRYSMSFSNTGASPAADVVLAVPVPEAVSYVENSATVNGVQVAFSADGGQSFAARAALTIEAGGQSRPAMPEDITHVRWAFVEGIPAGSSGTLSFDAVLK